MPFAHLLNANAYKQAAVLKARADAHHANTCIQISFQHCKECSALAVVTLEGTNDRCAGELRPCEVFQCVKERADMQATAVTKRCREHLTVYPTILQRRQRCCHAC